jgi:hypothetical protein
MELAARALSPALADPFVCRWICGDASWLASKEEEDAWGRAAIKRYTNRDLKCWTGTLGEHVVPTLLQAAGHNVVPRRRFGRIHPDVVTTSAVFEIKTQTYRTGGTAGEKIMGVPYKYCNFKEQYGLDVVVVCLARADALARAYGVLGPATPAQRAHHALWTAQGVRFLSIHDLIASILK